MKLEDLREEVDRISAAVATIRQSGISERALLLLIQHAAGSDERGRKLPQRTILRVMEGMEALEDFVFDEEDEYGCT